MEAHYNDGIAVCNRLPAYFMRSPRENTVILKNSFVILDDPQKDKAQDFQVAKRAYPCTMSGLYSQQFTNWLGSQGEVRGVYIVVP